MGDVSFTGLFKDFGIGLGIFFVGLIVGIPLSGSAASAADRALARQDQAQGGGLVHELEALHLAEEVAVDLVGERRVGLDDLEAVQVGADVERTAGGGCRCRPAPARPPGRWAGSRASLNVTTARPRSRVASGTRSSGRLPR